MWIFWISVIVVIYFIIQGVIQAEKKSRFIRENEDWIEDLNFTMNMSRDEAIKYLWGKYGRTYK